MFIHMYMYVYIYIYILGSEDYLPGRGLLLEVVVHPGASQSPRFCEDVLVAPGHHHAFVALPHRVVEDPGGPSAAHFSMYFLASAPSRLMSSFILTMSPFVVSTFFHSSSRSRDCTTFSSRVAAHRRRNSAFSLWPVRVLYSSLLAPASSRWNCTPRLPRAAKLSTLACCSLAWVPRQHGHHRRPPSCSRGRPSPSAPTPSR